MLSQSAIVVVLLRLLGIVVELVMFMGVACATVVWPRFATRLLVCDALAAELDEVARHTTVVADAAVVLGLPITA